MAGTLLQESYGSCVVSTDANYSRRSVLTIGRKTRVRFDVYVLGWLMVELGTHWILTCLNDVHNSIRR